MRNALFFFTEGRIDGCNRHRTNRRCGNNRNFVRGPVLSVTASQSSPGRMLRSLVSSFLCVRASRRLLSGGPSYQNKRQCRLWECKFGMPGVIGTWTPSPALHQVSQTATTLSTPTLVNSQVAADPGQDSGSHLSSANVGVALASHGTLLSMALTGLLATILVF
ncbi:hypothetical protein BJV77DRAFT_1002924 [Russula vinacea]|nr:hypothetical protein BJV77DRAFT_1002924 [Russula vinacea]